MNPLKDITAAVTAALREAGAVGISAHPSVHYDRRRAMVTYLGGPPVTVVEAVLEPLVATGVLKWFTVARHEQWSCGVSHENATAAWLAHEGATHVVHVTDTRCELGCDHGEGYLPIDTLQELVEAGETFRSRVCEPLVWPRDYPHAAD